MNSSRRFLLGSVLGFGGLGCAPLYGVPAYGTPPPDSAEFKLSGTVLDSESKAPIPGIVLFLGWKGAATSAEDGTWSLDVRGDMGTHSITARDTDGAANGSYLELEQPVSPTQVSPGDGAQDRGVYEQKGIQVFMVPPPTVYTYKLKGKLVDGTSLAPIPGISIAGLGHTAISGADGTWSLEFEAPPCQTCTLTFQDTDGTANASYTQAEFSIPFIPITKAGTPAVFLADCGLMGMTVKP